MFLSRYKAHTLRLTVRGGAEYDDACCRLTVWKKCFRSPTAKGSEWGVKEPFPHYVTTSQAPVCRLSESTLSTARTHIRT